MPKHVTQSTLGCRRSAVTHLTASFLTGTLLLGASQSPGAMRRPCQEGIFIRPLPLPAQLLLMDNPVSLQQFVRYCMHLFLLHLPYIQSQQHTLRQHHFIQQTIFFASTMKARLLLMNKPVSLKQLVHYCMHLLLLHLPNFASQKTCLMHYDELCAMGTEANIGQSGNKHCNKQCAKCVLHSRKFS